MMNKRKEVMKKTKSNLVAVKNEIVKEKQLESYEINNPFGAKQNQRDNIEAPLITDKQTNKKKMKANLRYRAVPINAPIELKNDMIQYPTSKKAEITGEPLIPYHLNEVGAIERLEFRPYLAYSQDNQGIEIRDPEDAMNWKTYKKSRGKKPKIPTTQLHPIYLPDTREY